MGEDLNLVYILSTYEENGAEDVTATLDRSCLLDMIDQNWFYEEIKGSYEKRKQRHEEWITEAKDNLKILLRKSDEELVGVWDCHDGWGGMQLHVVRLEKTEVKGGV